MKKIISVALLLSVLLTLLASCEQILPTEQNKPQSGKTQSVTWYEYFGTVSVVQSFGGDSEESFAATSAKVKALLEEYHKLYDIYHTYTDINNIKTINDNAGIAPVEVDRRIIDMLKFSVEMYELTGGEVNVMMGAVLRLWHDAREGNGDGTYSLPEDSALIEASLHTSISSLVIDEKNGTVFITDPNASLDVGAIAKGYATDKIADEIISDKSLSSDGYVLNIGGNIKMIGSKMGEDWRIGITNPDKTSNKKYATMISASDTSIVTSGDYERYFVVDGQSYHHIIDKDTLYPAKNYHSITIVTKSSALADALSTALFSMDKNEGYNFIANLDGVEAYWISATGNPVASKGFPEIKE